MISQFMQYCIKNNTNKLILDHSLTGVGIILITTCTWFTLKLSIFNQKTDLFYFNSLYGC